MSGDPGAPVPSGDAAWGGRLELLDPARLDEDQRRAYEELLRGALPWASRNGFAASTDDGRLIGPFNGFLHVPRLGGAFNAWVAQEQRGTGYDERVRQVVILTTGVAWSAAYEVYAHVAVGRAAGLSDAVLDVIRSGDAPTADFTPQEAAAYRFTHELVTSRSVGDGSYRAAVEAFGETGVLQMVHLIGQYLATSVLLNAFAVPAPPVPPPASAPRGATAG